MPIELAVDANCLIAALLGGRAREIVFSEQFALYSPQPTLFEVAKHLPWLAEKIGMPEAVVFREYQLLPIVGVQPASYDLHWQRATDLIARRDLLDVPLVALALARGCTVWTNDRDFENLPGITVVTTADLLLQLSEF